MNVMISRVRKKRKGMKIHRGKKTARRQIVGWYLLTIESDQSTKRRVMEAVYFWKCEKKKGKNRRFFFLSSVCLFTIYGFMNLIEPAILWLENEIVFLFLFFRFKNSLKAIKGIQKSVSFFSFITDMRTKTCYMLTLMLCSTPVPMRCGKVWAKNDFGVKMSKQCWL